VGHLGCFHSLAIVSSAAINRCAGAYLVKWLTFRYIPRSGIAGTYGRYIFSFLRSLRTVFHSGCSILHSQQQCMRVPFPLHSHWHLLLFVFLIVAILTGMRWNFNVVWICISFRARNGEHFFHVFFSHLDFFLWKGSIQFICSFLHWIIDFGGVWVFALLV
jgi:hypothetical protein